MEVRMDSPNKLQKYKKYKKYKKVHKYKSTHNSVIFRATDSRFGSSYAPSNQMRKYKSTKVQKYKSTKVQKNKKNVKSTKRTKK